MQMKSASMCDFKNTPETIRMSMDIMISPKVTLQPMYPGVPVSRDIPIDIPWLFH